MNEIPSRFKNKACMPSSFSKFLNCRMVLDCKEIHVDSPHALDESKKTFSHYKHMYTFKALVGVSPNGKVTYLSPLYPGSTSDKEFVGHCGVLEKLKPGDSILADKGFLINDILPQGVTCNIPPFRSTLQFTPAQVEITTTIARARVQVERAILNIKYCKILEMIAQKSCFQMQLKYSRFVQH